MNEVFDDACVRGGSVWAEGSNSPTTGRLSLRPSVAASTAWSRGVADEVLAALGINALSPDEILLDQFDLDPHGTSAVIVEQGSAMRRPLTTVVDVPATLGRAGTPELASAA